MGFPIINQPCSGTSMYLQLWTLPINQGNCFTNLKPPVLWMMVQLNHHWSIEIWSYQRFSGRLYRRLKKLDGHLEQQFFIILLYQCSFKSAGDKCVESCIFSQSFHRKKWRELISLEHGIPLDVPTWDDVYSNGFQMADNWRWFILDPILRFLKMQ